MTYEYFGVVNRVMDSGAGEVRGLARLMNGVPQPGFDPRALFAPDGNVFINRLPSQLRFGDPVAFDAEENPYRHGPDRFWVKQQHRSPRIDRRGFAVRDAAVLVADPTAPRPVLRGDCTVGDGLSLFLRFPTVNGPCLRGPFTVRNRALQGEDVSEWHDATWSAETHFEADDGSWEVVLFPLEANSGRPLDLMTGDELAKWFFKQAEELPPLAPIVEQLHRQAKKLLKSQFTDLTYEPERLRFSLRFTRVLSILEALESGHMELGRLAAAPAFAPLWQVAVAKRTGELEAEASVRLQERHSELRALSSELERRRHEKAELEATIEKLRVRQRDSKSELGKLGRQRREMDMYAGENQQRLLQDARALAPLFAAHEPASMGGMGALPAALLARERDEPATITTDRLRSDTVNACCLTLLLDPFYARDLAAEWGWSLFVLQVEPHWLCFADAWRAGLREILEFSASDGTTLLHLQDLDRSPPELWLRPLLDLSSGLRDILIEGESGWPRELRVTASLAPTPPRHPLSGWLLRHFAAPERMGPKTGGGQPESVTLGGLETFVHRETRALAERLAAHAETSEDEDRERCELRAREVRRDWPFTFARES